MIPEDHIFDSPENIMRDDENLEDDEVSFKARKIVGYIVITSIAITAICIALASVCGLAILGRIAWNVLRNLY